MESKLQHSVKSVFFLMFGCACRLFFFFLTMVRSPICKWNVWVRAVTFFRVWSPKNIKQWVPKTVRTFVVLPHLTMWCPAVTAWFSWPPWCMIKSRAPSWLVTDRWWYLRSEIRIHPYFSHIFIHGDKPRIHISSILPYFIPHQYS